MSDGEQEFEALDTNQIKMAEFLIEEQHPIAKTHYDIAFPWLCCISKCIRKSKERGEQDDIKNGPKQPLLDQKSMPDSKEAKKLRAMEKKKSQRNQMVKEDMKGVDPFFSLGFGLIAYRKTLFSLMMLFFVMSSITFPILQTYSSGVAINTNTTTSKFGVYSLANMGYSSIQCNSVPFGMEKLVLQCPYGSISGIVKDGVGINPKGSGSRDACLINSNNTDCSKNLDMVEFNKTFNSDCVGNQTCSFTFDSSSNYLLGNDATC